MSDAATSSIFELVASYYGELRSFARKKVGSATAADDVVQEACLRLAGVNLRQVRNPRAFLYRVVGNVAVDHQRRQRTLSGYLITVDGEADGEDATADVERQLVAKQQLALLTAAIAELPPRCRECFVMRRFDDLEQDEIARRMGISRNMVEKHLRAAAVHCLKRLREGD